ncbi:transposase [Paenibacillus thiaminolyticus]|uniref:Transposase n=1 Tax=Paenibacillus thiaminolyticus TaxID=49283 RepID=A0A3A3H0L0_PANTH|nr:transposase [Paenibacillus thiaminolyticus]RJG24516.1 transposase [Paenibacillus thiaminolyticus]
MEPLDQIATLEELWKIFATEADCAAYVEKIKWPEGYICPRCEHRQSYVIRTRRLPLYECRSCRHQTSLIAGTIMEGSRTSLRKWLAAIWLVSLRKTGINAVQLQAVLQVTYKTSWLILHKIRGAIHCHDTHNFMKGDVRGIIVFYGRPFSSPIVMHDKETAIIVAEGTSFSACGPARHYKMKLIGREHLSGKLLLPSGCQHFTEQHVEKNNDYETEINRYIFRIRRDSRLYLMYRQARQWLNQMFHGIGAKYLQRYLDEFIFRLNGPVASVASQLLQVCLMRSPVSVTHTGQTFPRARAASCAA